MLWLSNTPITFHPSHHPRLLATMYVTTPLPPSLSRPTKILQIWHEMSGHVTGDEARPTFTSLYTHPAIKFHTIYLPSRGGLPASNKPSSEQTKYWYGIDLKSKERIDLNGDNFISSATGEAHVSCLFLQYKKGEVGANSDFCLEVDWNSQQEIMTFGWAWININVYNSYKPLPEEKAAITSVQLL